jgi:hypothetical protein
VRRINKPRGLVIFVKRVSFDGRPLLGRRRERWQQHCEIYIERQILPGARKSMEPTASWPEDVECQRVKQFITDSPRDSEKTLNGMIQVMSQSASAASR